MPLFPKIVSQNSTTKMLQCQADKFRGWGLLLVTLQNDHNTILKLTATTEEGTERVTSLPIIDAKTKRGWIFRNKKEFSCYSAEIKYGEPKEIKFIKINAARAFISLIKYRWRHGQGLKSGLFVSLRCLKYLLNIIRKMLMVK